tara:strand:+ start:144 stop:347 length:204 start_codon:yes stop_codon:yes gene_type:complete
MSGNRYSRMPMANMITNAKQDAQIRALYQDLNRLATSVERELLRLDRSVSNDDRIDQDDALRYLLSG